MRGKKAKLIRKDAAIMASGVDHVNYEDINKHNKLVFNHLTIRNEYVPVYTRMLGACQRAMYKQLKQIHKKNKVSKK